MLIYPQLLTCQCYTPRLHYMASTTHTQSTDHQAVFKKFPVQILRCWRQYPYTIRCYHKIGYTTK